MTSDVIQRPRRRELSIEICDEKIAGYQAERKQAADPLVAATAADYIDRWLDIRLELMRTTKRREEG